MRPLHRNLVIVVTIMLAGFVGFGIARLSAGPSLIDSGTINIPASALTPTAGTNGVIANQSAVLGATDPEPTAVLPATSDAPAPSVQAPPAASPVEAIPPTAEPATSPVTFQIRELTNLRAEPGPDAPILKVLTAGNEILILGETQTAPDGGVWAKVRFGEQEGWLNNRLLR